MEPQVGTAMELHVTEVTIEDQVAIVRLNRPGRGNSWTSRMNAEYRWLIDRCDKDPAVRVIVVTGAGRQFCVGADFKARDHHAQSDADYVKASTPEAMAMPGHGVRSDFDHEMVWHWGLSKTVICAVNGVFPMEEFEARTLRMAKWIAESVSPIATKTAKRQSMRSC